MVDYYVPSRPNWAGVSCWRWGGSRVQRVAAKETKKLNHDTGNLVQVP